FSLVVIEMPRHAGHRALLECGDQRTAVDGASTGDPGYQGHEDDGCRKQPQPNHVQLDAQIVDQCGRAQRAGDSPGTGFPNVTVLSLLQRNWSGKPTHATLMSPDDSKRALPFSRSWCVRCTCVRGMRRVEDCPNTPDGCAADCVSRGTRSCRIARRR